MKKIKMASLILLVLSRSTMPASSCLGFLLFTTMRRCIPPLRNGMRWGVRCVLSCRCSGRRRRLKKLPRQLFLTI
ncbi:MAG: hypothetical protein V8T10_07990 [Merdibacter sp.]